MNAIQHVKHVIHTSTLPNLGVLEGLDGTKINESLLKCLKVDLTAKGSGFRTCHTWHI